MVAQLLKWLLPLPEAHGSNPNSEINEQFSTKCYSEKPKIMKNEAGNDLSLNNISLALYDEFHTQANFYIPRILSYYVKEICLYKVLPLR